jgi:hypothetical protein
VNDDTRERTMAYMLECEARWLLKTMTKEQRRAYLESKPVKGRRAKLEAEMLRQHKGKDKR